MHDVDIFGSQEWALDSLLGIESSFLRLNSTTIIHTWILLGILVFLLLIMRWSLHKENSLAQHVTLKIIDFFMQLVQQAIGTWHALHTSFIVTIFVFILLCNTLSLIPYLEEPTTDLNTTLALGFLSFIYVQITQIKQHGMWPYIKDYFSPFFIMFPLNLVGKLASIVSISFRLYGNIFGGSIITSIYTNALSASWLFQVIGIVTGINIAIALFFSLFEGFLQAFVFTMLTLTYLSIALQNED